MIAAVYARKSTEQNGRGRREVRHPPGRALARLCGARLLNALKPRPPFQVLVMSEESRLGREQIETAYALKQLVTMSKESREAR